MRRCPQSFLEHSSIGSLPVLPFLAPRASTPWPSISLVNADSSESPVAFQACRIRSAAKDVIKDKQSSTLLLKPRKQETQWETRTKSRGVRCSRSFHASARQHQSLDPARNDETFRLFEQQCRYLSVHISDDRAPNQQDRAIPKLQQPLSGAITHDEHVVSCYQSAYDHDSKDGLPRHAHTTTASSPTKEVEVAGSVTPGSTSIDDQVEDSASPPTILTTFEGSSTRQGIILVVSARRSIHLGDYEAALHNLSEAVEAGADTTSDLFKHACNRLLRQGRGVAGSYQGTSQIVERLIELGFCLDITSYNILIRNAFEADDEKTVWKIFKLIRRNKFEPNHYTWDTLLKVCRKTKDRSSFRKIYKQIREQEADPLPHMLVAEILVSWYKFGKRSDYRRLVLFYEQHCDLQILKDLGILNSGYQPRVVVAATRPPSTETLIIMLLAYIRKEQAVIHAAEVYRIFQRLLSEGHPLVVPLGEKILVYSIFMKAFGNRASSLKLWPRLLQDMGRSLGAEVVNRDTRRPFAGCKPNSIFWNILLNAFARSGQLAAAEKVMELMRQRGFLPDKYSYTGLIGGYARAQNVEMTVEVLRRMQVDNVAGDESTVRALQKLDDRPQLLELMQKLAKEHSLEVGTKLGDGDEVDTLSDALEDMVDSSD